MKDAASLSAVNITAIPSDADIYNGHSYKLFNNGMTWNEAKAYCEERGGHLVTVTDSSEQEFIQNLLADGSKNSYWMGGYKNTDGSWKWITDENWSYTNWSYRQPDGDGDALMIYNGYNYYSQVGQWNDFHVDGENGQDFFGLDNFGFICEWETDTPAYSKSITLTKKADNYTNTFYGATINALGGNDTIYNRADNAVIFGGNGADRIDNTKDNVVINCEAGNDSTFGGGVNTTVNGDAGNDRLEFWGITPVIDGGAGNDKIFTHTKGAVIIGGIGNDLIENWDDNVGKFDDGDGKDIILMGAGNDSLRNFGSGSTINAGKGSDHISLVGSSGNNLIQYAAGDGKDKIFGFNETDTLQVGDGKGTYSTKKSGNNVVVTVGKGSITLQGAASLERININSDMILTNSSKSPVIVDATTQIIDASIRTKAIKITGNGLANTIIGGSKNDSLYGRAGNDSIVGNSGNDKLYGSNGDDTLVGGKGNDTLWGDAGNDKLYGGSGKDIFIYKPGEGTDTIFDYELGDMLKILKSNGKDGGTFTNSTFKNNNLTLAIDGGGKVIFENINASDKFNINGTIHTIIGNKLK